MRLNYFRYENPFPDLNYESVYTVSNLEEFSFRRNQDQTVNITDFVTRTLAKVGRNNCQDGDAGQGRASQTDTIRVVSLKSCVSYIYIFTTRVLPTGGRERDTPLRPFRNRSATFFFCDCSATVLRPGFGAGAGHPRSRAGRGVRLDKHGGRGGRAFRLGDRPQAEDACDGHRGERHSCVGLAADCAESGVVARHGYEEDFG